jgi:carbamoyltransferase
LNTSFNLHGYPIVYSAEDALDVFERSGLEYLALGDYLVRKEPAAP